MSLTAMWTHGNSIVVENPEAFTSIRHFGFGTEMKLNEQAECWLHAAIPTPVILEDKRPKLRRVLLLYKTDPSIRLGTIHVFDAQKRIHDLGIVMSEARRSGGDFLTLGSNNSYDTYPLTVPYFGVGVSLNFLHLTGGRPDGRLIFISSVGADFEF